MIRHAEGTAGANGYRTLFGGKLFNDYAQHPRVKVPFRNTYSTAAGAYQFLYSTWYRLSLKLGLKDFSPESQDKACIELIREKNALEDVKNGNFESAIKKIAKVWASLPGAGYNQPEKKIAELQKVYTQNGGKLIA
ncbi:MAG: glycoside hydrolase family 104 protein [Sphingobacteriales bacterium]|nr:glycoside hydrolase family 104 protein [Sphingobacteriales bacterium]